MLPARDTFTNVKLAPFGMVKGVYHVKLLAVHRIMAIVLAQLTIRVIVLYADQVSTMLKKGKFINIKNSLEIPKNVK